MTIPPRPPPEPLKRGEAYQRCLWELRSANPDAALAQVYATLSVYEAVRDAAVEVASLGTFITQAATSLGTDISTAPGR
jgi:hypothetical protein